MIRSALLRRIYAVILLALVVTAGCTWLLFMLMSRSLFVNIRANEMLPRARSLSAIVNAYMEGRFDENLLLRLVDVNEKDTSIMNAYLIVADREGTISLVSDEKQTLDPQKLENQISEILSGRTVVSVLKSIGGVDIVTLGVPVYDDGGAISGALLLYVPQYETLAARSALAGALAMAMGIVVPIVFLLIYALVYQMIAPLRQMRDVALRMADGSFDTRADESVNGEVGQLGSSLNRLSKALKHNISELTFERNRLVQILNGLSEGIAAVDRIGNITHINPALEHLFQAGGCPENPRMNVIPREEVWAAFDQAINSGEGAHFTLSEGERNISCAISPVHDDKGGIAGAVGLFRDITSEVRLENTRREYVANVSHEMRTPLTAMRGLIEPLRDGMVKDENARKRYYDIILREILRLSRLINDLMELSRLQSGTLAIEPENFEIAEIAYDLYERYRTTCEEHGLTLALTADFEKFPLLFSNPDRVEQLLVILLDNAIKYTPSGGHIELGGEWDDERAMLRVKDTGLGIAPEHIDHIFERFYKVDKAHSGMGSGLGLSIAREMLEQMGEKIWVTSKVGEGSEFCFTVKRAAPPPMIIENE